MGSGPMLRRLSLSLLGAAAISALPPAAKAGIARPDHVVVVIEENHDVQQIVGNPSAPYINNTLKPNGLYFINGHGTDHDSQPNYLELFSGANPGVPGVNYPLQTRFPFGINPNDPTVAARENNSDNYNTNQPFTVPNLGGNLLAKGFTFTGYSESQPSVGYTKSQYPLAQNGKRVYVEKHNPWAQWQRTGTNQLPASTNQPLTSFPTDFNKLSTVSFIVPNEINDMHDTVSATGQYAAGNTGKDANGNPVNDSTTIQNGDTWLKNHIEAYRQWAITHNSLLIVTWDENDFDFARDNNIPILIDGAPNLVQTGVNYSYTNHFNVLRTIEDQYGLSYAGLSADVAPIATNANGQLAAVPLPAGVWTGVTGLLVAVGVSMSRRMKVLA